MALTELDCKNATCPEGKTRARLTDAGGLWPSSPTSTETAPQDEILLASIPKSITVYVKTWKGRRTIDVRCYVARGNGTAMPTRKGIQFDVKRLPAVLEAPRLAQQHVQELGRGT